MSTDPQDPFRRSRRGPGDGSPGSAAYGADLPDLDGDPRGRHATGRGQGFERAVGWTLLSAVVPGAGFIAAGSTGLGILAIVVVVALLLSFGGLAAMGSLKGIVATLTANVGTSLMTVALVMVVVALVWFVYIAGTHAVVRRFTDLTRGQRLLSTLLVVGLTALVALPAAQVGNAAISLRSAAGSITDNGNDITNSTAKPSAAAADPWKGIKRLNILLIGSDAGADRTGIRPDTLIIASLNPQTGNTVLFSIPRNLQHVPFPPGTQQAADYPNGYYCPERGAANACMINAMWQFGVEHKSTYYKGAKNPGLKAVTEAVEQVLGLQIDEYVMINLKGFSQFINAIGGLTFTLTQRLPIGGDSEGRPADGYLPVGKHHLTGTQTLWYARSRKSTSDWDRMKRQRCVIAAVVNQTSPSKIFMNITGILKAVKSNLKMSIKQSEFQAYSDLALRIKGAKVTSLALTNEVISSTNPDFTRIHALVKAAIRSSNATKSSTATATTTAGTTATSTPKPTKTKKKTNLDVTKAQDVNDIC